MSDEDTIFTDKERAELCLNEDCAEHGDGDEECDIPRTKGEASIYVTEQQKNDSAGASLQNVSPTTATGKVVRSDE